MVYGVVRCTGRECWERASLQAASSGEQVEDEDDYGEDKEDVDEASADVKAEAKQPEDDEDDHNRPKHNEVFSDQSGITVKERRGCMALCMVRCRVESRGCPEGRRILIREREIDATRDI